jgi:hypothetical protein
MYGKPDAERPGFGPYYTFLRRDVAPERLKDLARTHNVDRVYASTTEPELGLSGVPALLWSAALRLGRIATLGAWNPAASEHAAVFRKG